MRLATAVVLAVVLASLGAVALFALGSTAGDGQLTEQWVSDTARDNEFNHHAVGVGPAGDVVVAPIAELPNSDVPITDTSCALVRLAPESGATEWEAGVPAEDCFLHALTEPAISDIDGDDSLEIAVGTTSGGLAVYAADGGSEEFTVAMPTYGYARPTVADIHPADGNEVIASDIGGHAVAAYANGSVAWRTDLGDEFDANASVWDRALVTDADGDGTAEVIFGTGKGPVVLSRDGTIEWSARGGAVYLAVAQADGDDAREIFTADLGTIRAYDGGSGDVEWEREFRGSARIREAGDADGDGTTELFVGRVNGTVLSLNAETGATEWSTTVTPASESTVQTPVLADVDGDDTTEVVVGTKAGSLSVLDSGTGEVLATYERAVPILTFPTAADTDGDGRAEILVQYGDARVVALGYSS